MMTDEPKSLRDSLVLKQRLAMIHQEHVAPLTLLVDGIRRTRPDAIVPYFDPLDGGINARVLFLLETPGPNAKHFVSRNNPDETARNMFELQREAGIARCDTLFWNVVAWYLGDGKRRRRSQSSDFDENRAYLNQLLSLLGRLRAVVLLGNRAQTAWDRSGLQIPGIAIHRTYHTSPCALNTAPSRRGMILDVFHQIVMDLSR